MFSALCRLVTQTDESIPCAKNVFRRAIKIDIRLRSNPRTLHRFRPLREALQHDVLYSRVAERGSDLAIRHLNAAKAFGVVVDVAIDLLPHPERQIVSTPLPQRQRQSHKAPVRQNVLPLGVRHGTQAVAAWTGETERRHDGCDVRWKITHGFAGVDEPTRRGQLLRRPFLQELRRRSRDRRSSVRVFLSLIGCGVRLAAFHAPLFLHTKALSQTMARRSLSREERVGGGQAVLAVETRCDRRTTRKSSLFPAVRRSASQWTISRKDAGRSSGHAVRGRVRPLNRETGFEMGCPLQLAGCYSGQGKWNRPITASSLCERKRRRAMICQRPSPRIAVRPGFPSAGRRRVSRSDRAGREHPNTLLRECDSGSSPGPRPLRASPSRTTVLVPYCSRRNLPHSRREPAGSSVLAPREARHTQ